MFVVFRKRSQQTAVRSPKAARANFQKLAPVQDLTGPWTVQFDLQWFYPTNGLSGDQAKGLIAFEKLEDWINRPEEAVRYFSGMAVYRKVFDFAPEVRSQPTGGSKTGSDLRLLASDLSSRLFLDLGTVKETARVWLNGQDLGVVWCHPWRVEITDAIKPGENKLEIEVVNLWPNRLVGDSKLPAELRRTRSNIEAQSVLSSGLRGPVRVLAADGIRSIGQLHQQQ